jgi:hypothetical protein
LEAIQFFVLWEGPPFSKLLILLRIEIPGPGTNIAFQIEERCTLSGRRCIREYHKKTRVMDGVNDLHSRVKGGFTP